MRIATIGSKITSKRGRKRSTECLSLALSTGVSRRDRRSTTPPPPPTSADADFLAYAFSVRSFVYSPPPNDPEKKRERLFPRALLMCVSSHCCLRGCRSLLVISLPTDVQGDRRVIIFHKATLCTIFLHTPSSPVLEEAFCTPTDLSSPREQKASAIFLRANLKRERERLADMSMEPEYYFGEEIRRQLMRFADGRGEAFGSLSVTADSPTPYTDATQVREEKKKSTCGLSVVHSPLD